jgi:hypothetical protein
LQKKLKSAMEQRVFKNLPKWYWPSIFYVVLEAFAAGLQKGRCHATEPSWGS